MSCLLIDLFLRGCSAKPTSAILSLDERLAASERQLFNDAEANALWLVVWTPREFADTLETTPAQLYPDRPKALPPELEG
jgi:hypothetical protein